MLGRLLTVLIAFIWACLAAGLTQAFFATTPAELSALPPDVAADRMARVVETAIFAGAQSLLFAAPFALVAAAIGEWRRLRSWTFYAVIGVAIALVAYLAQHSSELPGQPTIINNYALTAFLTSGFLAGLVYWLVAGRSAGGPETRMPPLADGNSRPASRPSSPTAVPSAGTQPKKA